MDPVGLITTDEIILAGSGMFNSENTQYYLYKGQVYWIMSPYYFHNGAFMFFVAATGHWNAGPVQNQYAAVPVINLSFKTVSSLVGTGSSNDPYRLP